MGMKMISRLDQVERVAELSRRLVAEHRKYAAMKERAAKAPIANAAKFKTDLDWQAQHINELEASVHAACVDAGLADLRDLDHYAEKVFHFGTGHEHRWQPARPALIST